MSRFENACAAYSAIVARLYYEAVQRNGYGYAAVPDAPSSYEGVCAARRLSEDTLCPFPVWDGGSERTVFVKPEQNYMFRYLHDHDHACNGYTLSPEHERILGYLWALRVQRTGAGRDVVLLAELDTVAQTNYYVVHGEFPSDQRAFVKERFESLTRG